MDNDNKIVQTPAIIVKKFLGDNLSEIPRNAKTTYYDLEDAFDKTKRNHSKRIFLILLLLTAATVATAYLLTHYVQESSRNVSIDINAIDNLNLKNILDVVEKTKEAHERAVRNLEMLKTNRKNELNTAESTYNQTINSINAMQGKRSKKTALIKKANQDYETEKKHIMASYEFDIQEAEVELAKQESNLTAFDANRVKEAEVQQELINNQKRLFDLEKRTLIKEYESRITALENYATEQRLAYEKINTGNVRKVQNSYEDRINAIDPVFKDKKAARILTNAAIDANNLAYIPFTNTPDDIPPYVPVKKETYENIAAKYRDLSYLTGKLKTVPFENEIPQYLAAIDILLQKAGAESETAVMQSTATIQTQNQQITEQTNTISAQEQQLNKQKGMITAQINQLNDKNELIAALLKTARSRNILDYYTRLDAMMAQRSIAAVILNTDNPNKIQIRANQALTIKDGAIGYVFRNETQYIGEIQFISDGKEVTAQLKPGKPEIEQPMIFKVMDTIFLSK